jgi:hypothetical protein
MEPNVKFSGYGMRHEKYLSYCLWYPKVQHR